MEATTKTKKNKSKSKNHTKTRLWNMIESQIEPTKKSQIE